MLLRFVKTTSAMTSAITGARAFATRAGSASWGARVVLAHSGSDSDNDAPEPPVKVAPMSDKASYAGSASWGATVVFGSRRFCPGRGGSVAPADDKEGAAHGLTAHASAQLPAG